ncbi:hypothetical protein PRIPAC_97096 [Pristionchus pacificus]|uniref:Uncharacterized protein n=1 Tax=Pristionchus pacificus TaxID=54126 RepID=A0A2A6D246_PRIPA|nr:hypothetical protein PRIPAC_97096 [Pristionchus pacificus]|eukprot:PDM84416.1 hypothetical protein PRIPAC_33439 [Pristionchus pacificus]
MSTLWEGPPVPLLKCPLCGKAPWPAAQVSTLWSYPLAAQLSIAHLSIALISNAQSGGPNLFLGPTMTHEIAKAVQLRST